MLILPSEGVTVGVPQLSVAVGLTVAGSPPGLHPRSEPLGVEVNTGACVSVTVNNLTHCETTKLFFINAYRRVKAQPHTDGAFTVTDPTVGLVRVGADLHVLLITDHPKVTSLAKSDAATPLVNVLEVLHSIEVGSPSRHTGGSNTASAESERFWFPSDSGLSSSS